MNILNRLLLGVASLSLLACSPSASQLSEILEKHPEVLTNAIEKNPEKFSQAMLKVNQIAQNKARENAALEEAKRFEAEFQNPLKPEIDPKRPVMGPAEAPIMIVEYTDFQCPYCGKAFQTVEDVRKEYGDKVHILVKNLPLPMHPMAMPAAKRFEALMIQSPKKAFEFYHEVFTDQTKLSAGQEKFLDQAVKHTGANLERVKKDMESDQVKTLIANDTAEANKFGIHGTPGFIVEGVSIRGAYPIDTFKKIIDRKLAAAK